METVLHALAIYLLLLVVFRIAGKRSVAQITTFDLVLLLIVGEATQQALLGDDFSVTTAVIVIVTLVGFDVLVGVVARRTSLLQKLIESVPVVLVRDGAIDRERMEAERVSEDMILEQARAKQGLERMDDVKHAVLETSGGISIIPKGDAG